MSSHSFRFFSGVLNLNSKVYSKLLWMKNYQENVETHKIDDPEFHEARLASFVKRVTKFPFSFPVAQGSKSVTVKA